MGVYDEQILPHVVVLACGGESMRERRARVIPRARGRVLEVGVGAGFNLPFYDPAQVAEVVGIEPSAALMARARRVAAGCAVRSTLTLGTFEELDAADRSFDTIVFTFTLCSVADAAAALAKARRLLRDDGELLVCEHGRAPEPWVRRVQRWLQPAWGYLGGGCQLGRDILGLLDAAGFDVSALHTSYASAFRPASYTTCGAARPR